MALALPGVRGEGGRRPLTLLAECLILAVDTAASEVALAHWWGEHQAALKMLPRDDLARVVAAKDRRQAEWRRESEDRAKAARQAPRPTFWDRE
jgi:hypothetical protein